MRNLFYYGFAMAAILSSCEENLDGVITPELGVAQTITASIESPKSETRTTLEGTEIHWAVGDAINVWNNGNAEVMNFTANESGATTTFTTDSVIELADSVIALYPHNENNSYVAKDTENAEGASFVFPATQNYVANGIDQTVAFSYAKGLKDALKFENQFGVLSLNLRGTAKIGRIEIANDSVEGKNGMVIYPIAHKVTAKTSTEYGEETNFKIEGTPEQKLDSIALNCEGGIQLKEDTDTQFNIVMLPTGRKLKITFFDQAGDSITSIKPTTAKVMRSGITIMPSLTVDDEGLVSDPTRRDTLGFETQSKDWYINPDFSTLSFCKNFEGKTRSGIYAVKYNSDELSSKDVYFGQKANRPCSINENGKYEVSFWVYLDNNSSISTIKTAFKAAGYKTDIQTIDISSKLKNKWEKVTCEFDELPLGEKGTEPEKFPGVFQITIPGGSQGTMYIDDVTIEKKTDTPAE